MYSKAFVFVLNLMCTRAGSARFCERTKAPFELGEWRGHMKHLDSATIENKPVSMNEGQVYVYENTFPGYTIRYVNVDNLAIKTCGASANLKRGGLGTSTLLIVLHAATNQEIRSVIDVWGVKNEGVTRVHKDAPPKNMKSRYLFEGLRTVNHNNRFIDFDRKDVDPRKFHISSSPFHEATE